MPQQANSRRVDEHICHSRPFDISERRPKSRPFQTSWAKLRQILTNVAQRLRNILYLSHINASETVPFAEHENGTNGKASICQYMEMATVFFVKFQHTHAPKLQPPLQKRQKLQPPLQKRQKLIPQPHRCLQRMHFSERKRPEVHLRT